MKNLKTLAILVFSIVIFLAACKDKSKTPPPRATKSKPVSFEPPQNARGVWHYVCSKRCAGGSGAIGNCTTCGAALVHNGLYHANNSTKPTTAPSSGAPFATPPVTAPATNASGIYHYTCAIGCAGGSGTTGTCATCGGPLSHNQAYH